MIAPAAIKQSRRARPRTAGFTLIEILITLAILAFILDAVSSTFAVQERAMKLQEGVSETQQNLRAAAEAINSDLANVGGGIEGAQCNTATLTIRGGAMIDNMFVGRPGGGYQFTRGVWATNGLNNVPPNIVTPASPPDNLPPAAKNPPHFDTLAVQTLEEVTRSRLIKMVDAPKAGAWTIEFCADDDLNGLAKSASTFVLDDLVVVTDMQFSAIFRITAAPQVLAANAADNCQVANKIRLTCATGGGSNDLIRHRPFTVGVRSGEYFRFFEGRSWVALLKGGVYRTVLATDEVYDTRYPRPILMKETEPIVPAANTLTMYPVADNIATLQLGFGVNRPANVYSISHLAQPLAGEYDQTDFDFFTVGAGNYIDPARVRSVVVNLLARTERPEMVGATATVMDAKEEDALRPQSAPLKVGDYTLAPANTGFRYRLNTHVTDLKGTYGDRSDSAEVKLAMEGCK